MYSKNQTITEPKQKHIEKQWTLNKNKDNINDNYVKSMKTIEQSMKTMGKS